MTYAAQVEDGTVVQVIVGDAGWANTRLGGTWVDTDTLVGIGWTYTNGQFEPPISTEEEEVFPETEDA